MLSLQHAFDCDRSKVAGIEVAIWSPPPPLESISHVGPTRAWRPRVAALISVGFAHAIGIWIVAALQVGNDTSALDDLPVLSARLIEVARADGESRNSLPGEVKKGRQA